MRLAEGPLRRVVAGRARRGCSSCSATRTRAAQRGVRHARDEEDRHRGARGGRGRRRRRQPPDPPALAARKGRRREGRYSSHAPQARRQAQLSPSDLSAYLACPHLTTLSLEVALGERSRPHTREALAELVAEKGDLHEARYLEHLREQGATSSRSSCRRSPARSRRRMRRRSRRCAPGAEVDLPGDVLARRLARAGRLPRSGRRAVRPRRVELRAVRHEARAQREAGRRAPARVVRGRDRGDPGAAARAPARRARDERGRDLSGRPTSTPTCASRSGGCARTSRSGRRRTRGRASTARAATSSRSAAQRWIDDDHLTRVASIRRDQIGKLETVDVTTLTGLAESPAGSARPAAAPAMVERLRDQAALQLHRYRDRRASRTTCLRPRSGAGSASCRRRRRATSSSTWRATRSSTRPRGLEFLFGVLWREPDGSTTYRAVLGPRPRRGAGRVRAVRRLRRRAAARVPGHARLPLRRLRAVDARAADGHARDARGGDRRAAARRGARRPAPGRAAGAARRRRVVLAEGVEKLFFTREAEVSSGNEAVIEFERWLDDRDAARLDGDRRLQRGGLPRDARAARLAARRGGPRRSASTASRSRSCRRPSATRRRRPTRRRTRPHGSATRCSPRRSRATAELLARGCSSTTGARRGRAGGGTSAACAMTDEELADDGEALGVPRARRRRAGRSLDRESARKSLEWTFTLPAAAAPVRRGRRRRGSARGRHRLDGLGDRQRDRHDRAPARQGACATRRCRPRSSRAGRSPRRRSRRRCAGSPPRCSPATAATRTSSGCCGASRRSAARRCSAASSPSSARCSTGSRARTSSSRGRPGRARPTAARG